MAMHQHEGRTWWCLPGGGVECGETPEDAALRELHEECGVDGKIMREITHLRYTDRDSYTFLVDIGSQTVQLGADPEFPQDGQILVDIGWLSLAEIPERDRAFLWASGLLSVPEFLEEVTDWGNNISYPVS